MVQCNCNIFAKILCIYCGYFKSPTFVVYLKSSEAKIWKDHSLGLLFTNKSILSTRTGFWWKIWQCLTTRLYTATKVRMLQVAKHCTIGGQNSKNKIRNNSDFGKCEKGKIKIKIKLDKRIAPWINWQIIF